MEFRPRSTDSLQRRYFPITIIPLIRRRRSILLPYLLSNWHVHRPPLQHPPCTRDSLPILSVYLHSIINKRHSNLHLPLHPHTNPNTANRIAINILLPPRLSKPLLQLPLRIQRLQLGKRNGRGLRTLAQTQQIHPRPRRRRPRMGEAQNAGE